MKKGCLGCLGCGCFSIIVITILTFAGIYHWSSTEGKKIAVELMDNVGVEIAKSIFDENSAAEIGSLSAELKQDVMDGRLGIIDSFKYCYDNETETLKLQSEILLTALYNKVSGKRLESNDDPNVVDPSGAEAIRTVLYHYSQGKLEPNSVERFAQVMVDNRAQANNGGIKIKGNVKKRDLSDGIEALKKYVADNNLQLPPADVTVDKILKEDLIKFIKNLREACTKK